MIWLMVGFFAAGVRRASWFPAAFGAYYRLVLPATAAAEERSRIIGSAFEIAAVLEQAWCSFGRAEADLRLLIPTIWQPVLFTWATSDRIVQLGRNLESIVGHSDLIAGLSRLESVAAKLPTQDGLPEINANRIVVLFAAQSENTKR
jgi:hypothetical protein